MAPEKVGFRQRGNLTGGWGQRVRVIVVADPLVTIVKAAERIHYDSPFFRRWVEQGMLPDTP